MNLRAWAVRRFNPQSASRSESSGTCQTIPPRLQGNPVTFRAPPQGAAIGHKGFVEAPVYAEVCAGCSQAIQPKVNVR